MRKIVKWTGISALLFCAGLAGVVGYGALQARKGFDAEITEEF